jgi:predicted nucleotidyltransferase
MQNEVEDPTLREIISKLVTEFHPEKAYLFGSRARGEAHLNSDYDLLLVVQSSDRGRLDRMSQARLALETVDASVDVFIYTKKEFDEWKNEFSSIPETALREGLELQVD